MGKFWTYEEIRTKIQRDTDIEAEDFIQGDELLGIVNEAIDLCESKIHKLGLEDDYFIKHSFLEMVQGQDLINLPDDIYGFKIRGLIYQKNERRYPVKRIRGRRIFTKISNIQHFSNTDDYYQYFLVNDASVAAAQILLLPESRESSTDVLKIWYIRNANRMENDASICDIPEFVHYIIKRAVFQIYRKEGHPLMQEARAEMEKEEANMIDTLSTMVPDEDSTIEPDLDHYRDMAYVDMYNV